MTTRPVGLICDWLGVLTGSADDGVGGVFMTEVVGRARAAGIRTAALSNAEPAEWPWTQFDGLFDYVVLSGEVGLRKPDPAIFRHVVRMIGLAPGQCVFVDDAVVNVRAAVGVGMVGVHHTSTARTVTELEAILGLELRDGS